MPVQHLSIGEMMSNPSSSNSLYGYDRGAIFLHWIIAFLIIIQLVMGFAMMQLPQLSDSVRFSMFQWHKTFGLLVLLLTVVRIVWRLLNRPPAHAPMSRLELIAANTVTFLFYMLMLIVPLTGWALVSLSPTSIPTLFFKIPGLVWPDLPLTRSANHAATAAQMHAILGYSFVVLLFLHIGGALKHVVIDRIPELSRILPNAKLPRKPSSVASRYMAAALIIILTGAGLLAGHRQALSGQSTPAQPETAAQSSTVAANWVIDYAQSSLTYRMDFSGTTHQGKAGDWNASVSFLPDNLAASKAEVVINSSSLTYDDSYVAENIKLSDGLDTAKYPQIKVTLDTFERSASGFIAHGSITIRDTTLPIDLPFQLSEKDGVTHVTGTAQIERLAFGIGKQNDADGQWLGKTISIDLDITAQRK